MRFLHFNAFLTLQRIVFASDTHTYIELCFARLAEIEQSFSLRLDYSFSHSRVPFLACWLASSFPNFPAKYSTRRGHPLAASGDLHGMQPQKERQKDR
jgi:hypothetical protein